VVKEMITQLAGVIEVIKDTMIMHIVMNVLPTSFETFIQSVITQDVLPSFEKLIGKFLLEEHRQKTKFSK